MNLDKACQNDISRKAIKGKKDTFARFIAKDFSNCIDKVVIPDDLKHTDVTSVHKKGKKRFNKTN